MLMQQVLSYDIKKSSVPTIPKRTIETKDISSCAVPLYFMFPCTHQHFYAYLCNGRTRLSLLQYVFLNRLSHALKSYSLPSHASSAYPSAGSSKASSLYCPCHLPPAMALCKFRYSYYSFSSLFHGVYDNIHLSYCIVIILISFLDVYYHN